MESGDSVAHPLTRIRYSNLLRVAASILLLSSCGEGPTPPVGDDPPVAAIVYGAVVRVGQGGVGGLLVGTWAHKNECRPVTPAAPSITLTNAVGFFRQVIQVRGTAGRGCLTARFYFSRNGVPDSLDISGRFAEFVTFTGVQDLDSVRIDASLPAQ